MMTAKIPFTVLSSDDALRARIVEAISTAGLLRVVADGDKPEAIEEHLAADGSVGVYVDLGGDPEKALGWIEALAEPRPPVLAGGPPDPALILRAMRAGALGYFPEHDLDEELERIADRLRAQLESGTPEARGHVVAVLGTKGGVGTTTVACELAAELSRRGQDVALVDGKAYFGDVALHLDVSPSHTLADVAARGADLDAAFLETVAHPHEGSGIHVVAAPGDPEEAEAIEAHHVESTVELLQSVFDYVVVDLPRLTDDVSLHVLDRAARVVLVTSPSVTALARAQQHQKVLEQLGHDADKVHLVVNRSERPGMFADEDPVAAIGLSADVRIPVCDRVAESIEVGAPVSADGSDSVAHAAFIELCDGILRRCGSELALTTTEASANLAGRVRQIAEAIKCRLANG